MFSQEAGLKIYYCMLCYGNFLRFAQVLVLFLKQGPFITVHSRSCDIFMLFKYLICSVVVT